MTEPSPWYQQGLRFQCTQCGNCCSGPPGVVWVTNDELKAIAEFRGQSIGETRINHTRLIGNRMTLREFANGDCTFLDSQTRRCSIYSTRPAQCRTWPFWNSNLASIEAWQNANRICPGIDHGQLVPLEIIQEQAAVIDI